MLVTALRGAVLDVAVDVSDDSPTFGRPFKVGLNDETGDNSGSRLAWRIAS
jgi:dTDP-4-dehydrorhamnose 3,5-epimerase-like enzyme